MRLDTLEAWTELNWYDFYVVLLNDEKIYTLNSTESHLQRRDVVWSTRLSVRFAFSHTRQSALLTKFFPPLFYVFYTDGENGCRNGFLIRRQRRAAMSAESDRSSGWQVANWSEGQQQKKGDFITSMLNWFSCRAQRATVFALFHCERLEFAVLRLKRLNCWVIFNRIQLKSLTIQFAQSVWIVIRIIDLTLNASSSSLAVITSSEQTCGETKIVRWYFWHFHGSEIIASADSSR